MACFILMKTNSTYNTHSSYLPSHYFFCFELGVCCNSISDVWLHFGRNLARCIERMWLKVVRMHARMSINASKPMSVVLTGSLVNVYKFNWAFICFYQSCIWMFWTFVKFSCGSNKATSLVVHTTQLKFISGHYREQSCSAPLGTLLCHSHQHQL